MTNFYDRRRLLATLALLSCAGASAQTVSLGLYPSYAGGMGLQSQFAFPAVYDRYGFRFVSGLHLADPYDDNHDFGGFTLGDVKRGGNLTEFGVNVTAGMDVTYLLSEQSGWRTRLFGGPRLSGFLGVLSGPELNMTTSTAQAGLGGGALLEYALGRNLAFTAEVGLDAYGRSTFTHQQSSAATSYASMTYEVRPGDPEYREFDQFVQQPTLLAKLKLGLSLIF